MGKAVELREVEIAALRPYERNAKQHGEDQIRLIRQSIEKLGFISPCLIDKDLNVIAGHGRIMAAREAGMEKVPCVFVEGLTEKQRKAYILADNRLAEFSDWDMDLIRKEIADLQIGDFDFLSFDIDMAGFEDLQFGEEEDADPDPDEDKPGKAWTTRGVKCDMKPHITIRVKSGHQYVSLYASSKEGMTLEEIKNSRQCEKQMSDELAGCISQLAGMNLGANGWAMITTGRRRHRDGYHFATAVCSRTAKKLGMKFYEGAISCSNSDRLKPELQLVTEPEEKNLILFDDIITTGTTMSRTIDLLQAKGYTVLTIIGIRNQ